MIRAMFGFGGFGGEVIFIFLLALLIFGPEKLPEIGRVLAKTLGEVRKASNDLKRTLNAELAIHEQEQESRRQAVIPAAVPALRVVPPVAALPDSPVLPDSPAAPVAGTAAANSTVPFPSSIALAPTMPAAPAMPPIPAIPHTFPPATVPQSPSAPSSAADANGGAAGAGLLAPYGDGGEPHDAAAAAPAIPGDVTGAAGSGGVASGAGDGSGARRSQQGR
jgi:sec-independent protein translocase protein TatB